MKKIIKKAVHKQHPELTVTVKDRWGKAGELQKIVTFGTGLSITLTPKYFDEFYTFIEEPTEPVQQTGIKHLTSISKVRKTDFPLNTPAYLWHKKTNSITRLILVEEKWYGIYKGEIFMCDTGNVYTINFSTLENLRIETVDILKEIKEHPDWWHDARINHYLYQYKIKTSAGVVLETICTNNEFTHKAMDANMAHYESSVFMEKYDRNGNCLSTFFTNKRNKIKTVIPEYQGYWFTSNIDGNKVFASTLDDIITAAEKECSTVSINYNDKFIADVGVTQ